MPIITGYEDAIREYEEAAAKGICLPAFAAEDRETLEAILAASVDVAAEVGRPDLPVIVTWTTRYPLRPQMTKVFSCGDPSLGMQAMLSDLRILMSERGPYNRLRVLPHLDHFVPARDAAILEDHWDNFASVLVDASDMTDADNIAITREYVDRFRGRRIVEGVVDCIGESGSPDGKVLKTTVEKARNFRERTGVDLLVPNVGTEHRSTSQTLEYDERLARRISAEVGRILSLHGTSSLNERNFARLSECGFLKINIFTALAVVGGQAVARQVLENIGNLFDEKLLAAMTREGIVGANVLALRTDGKTMDARPRLEYLANEHRRNAWFRAVKDMCRRYFFLLNYSRYGIISPGCTERSH